MSTKEISNANQCLIVLKHFVELSTRILPAFISLEFEERKTSHQNFQYHKIIDVYQENRFDLAISDVLMGSNILSLIQDTFQKTFQHQQHEAICSFEMMMAEYKRIKFYWEFAQNN